MPTRVFSTVCVLIAMLSGACASTTNRAARQNCVISAADSAFIGAQPLYRDCAVDREARAISTRIDVTKVSAPPSGSPCFAAEVQFVVGVDGRPEENTIHLVRTSADAFGREVLASVPGWRYTPAMLGGQPVRQLVRVKRDLALRVVVVSGRSTDVRPPRAPNC